MDTKLKQAVENLIACGQKPDYEELVETEDGLCLDTQFIYNGKIFRKLEYETYTIYCFESNDSLIITD